MKLNQTFNAAELPQAQSYEPLPAGWYNATITSAELCNTKAGNGQYIKLRFDVTGPTHQGRVVFTNLNIVNPNPKAEEIGRRELNSIMGAAGIGSLSDTDQLIGVNLGVNVTVKDDPQYGPGNEVKGYKALSGSVAPVAAASRPTAAGTPPWAK